MPVYTITAPNGKTYSIEGPEGATEEQVRAEVLRRDPSAAEPRRLDADKPPEALRPAGDGEFTGEQGARYSEKPRQPLPGLTQLGLTEEDTNRYAGPQSVEDLMASIYRTFKPYGVSERPTAGGAFLRGAGRATGPTAGGLAGASAGAGLGLMTGPAAPVAIPVFSVLGGIGGALAGAYGQEKVLEQFPEFKARVEKQREADVAAQPYAAFAGEMAPSLVTGRPNLRSLNQLVGSAALSGGLEAATEAYEGDAPDIKKVGIAALGGALTSKQNRLGDALFGKESDALTRTLSEFSQPQKASEELATGALRIGEKPTPAMTLPEGALARIVSDVARINPDAAARLQAEGQRVVERAPVVGERLAYDVMPGDTDLTPAFVKDEADRIKRELQERYGITQAEREAAEAQRTAAVEQVRSKETAFREAQRLQARDTASSLRENYLDTQEQLKAVKEAMPARVEQATAGILPETRVGAPAAYEELAKQRDDARANFKKLYKEAEASGDVLLPQGERVNAELAAAAKEYAGTLEGGEAEKTERIVAKINKRLEDEGHLTFADLNSLRRQLQGVAPSAGTDYTAARSVINKIDEIEDLMLESGSLGDSDVVQKWRAANDARRQFAKDWEGNVFERALEGQDPQAVTVTLFGTASGPPVRGPNRAAEISAVLERLSPEARVAVQQDAMDRLFSKDVGKTTFGRAFRKWERENPELAALLVPPEARDAVVRARGDIALIQREMLDATRAERAARQSMVAGSRAARESQVDAAQASRVREAEARGAAETSVQEAARREAEAKSDLTTGMERFNRRVATTALGESFLSSTPEDFSRRLTGATPEDKNMARVGVRGAVREMLSDVPGSIGAINSLASNRYAQSNLRTLLGDDEADEIITTSKAASAVMARGLDLGGTAKAAARSGSVSEQDGAEIVPQGLAITNQRITLFSTALNNVSRALTARGLNRDEALEVADALLDPSRSQAVAAQLEQQVGKSGAELAMRRARAFYANVGRQLGTQATIQTVQALQPEAQPPGPPAEEPATAEFTSVKTPNDVIPKERAVEVAIPIIANESVEGTGDNPNSTAAGYGQFTDGTFIAYYRKVRPEESKDMSEAQILAQRGTGVEKEMMEAYTQESVDRLERERLPITVRNIYALHHMGHAGGLGLLQARPDAAAEVVLGTDVVSANPQFAGKTVGEALAWLEEHAAKGIKPDAS